MAPLTIRGTTRPEPFARRAPHENGFRSAPARPAQGVPEQAQFLVKSCTGGVDKPFPPSVAAVTDDGAAKAAVLNLGKSLALVLKQAIPGVRGGFTGRERLDEA
jgi:hypothetical protein